MGLGFESSVSGNTVLGSEHGVWSVRMLSAGDISCWLCSASYAVNVGKLYSNNSGATPWKGVKLS